MSLELTYKQASCVLLTPEYVSGIVAHPDVTAAANSPRTQFLESEGLEAAIYGTVQIVNLAQPPGQAANISITETSDESLSRLADVALVAFNLILKNQYAAAMGVNFQAMVTPPEGDTKALLLRLLNPQIIEDDNHEEGKPSSGGIRLIYDKEPWRATVMIEEDQMKEGQLACVVNFNINKPLPDQIALIGRMGELREWFDRVVKNVVGMA